MFFRLLIILGVIGLSEYYSFIVVKSMLKNLPSSVRISLFVFYLTMTAICWLSFIFFRQINWAAMPHYLRNLFIAIGMGMVVGKILILMVMLLDEARRLFTWLIASMTYTNRPDSGTTGAIERSIFLKQLALIMGGLSLFGFMYGIKNRYNFRVRKLKIQFNNLPVVFRGMKIAQLSDIHTGSFDNHKDVERGIRMVMEQNPDIIFFTGDLVNNHAHEVTEEYKKIFSLLKAPLGVFSILGNHDYGDYAEWHSETAKSENLQTLKNIHGEVGWRLLLNEHVVIEKGEHKMAVLGIENWSSKARFPKYGSLSKAHLGLPEKKIPFKILLSHDPSHWDEQVTKDFKDVDITFSGHTHGMQFGVESKWLKWSPVQYMYEKWAGLYQTGSQFLYVNRGFGFIGYPGRVGILPEITLIELT